MPSAVLAALALAPLSPTGDVAPGLGAQLPCVFHQATGLPCPLCGMTRAFVNMAHLEVARAAAFSPAGSVVFAFLVCRLALAWAYCASGRPVLGRLAGRNCFGILLVITLAGWLARLCLAAQAGP
ncbi:MAG: DUF2752 domain-containing protein [Pseudomonadota bacterium]